MPGTYKEHRWGCLVNLTTGAGPTTAPRSPPRENLRPRHSPPLDPGLLPPGQLDSPAAPAALLGIHGSFTDSFVGWICVFQL